MKKNVKALIFVLIMALCVSMLAACGGQGAESTEAAVPGYSVKVVDAFGNPCTEGVIVRFLQNGQQVTMQMVDGNGIAAKDLEKGEYTVELQLTGDDAFYYDDANMTLTADKTSLEVVLYKGMEGEPTNVFAPSLTGTSIDMPAYNLPVGATYVELEAGERNYFLFCPTEAGLYEFSVLNSDAILGYYGIPYFVQGTTITEPVDGKIQVNMKQHMIGEANILVFALDATGTDTDAIFAIQRIGEAVTDESDVPFEVYKAKTEPSAFTLPAGTKTADFDLTAATDTYTLVLGSDNYYHMNTAAGPLVLVKLGEASGGSKYLTYLEEMATKAQVCKYFYDENGEFIRKETYNECIQNYAACDDEKTGLYPLTEDLKYIIQMRGDHYGWFEEANTKHGYIFMDDNGNPVPGINNEISWLVLCCYIVE